MKRKIIICFILTAITLLSSCAAKSVGIIPSSETPDSAAGAYHKISSEEAKIMMESGGVTVVDVRRPEEYAENISPEQYLCQMKLLQKNQTKCSLTKRRFYLYTAAQE